MASTVVIFSGCDLISSQPNIKADLKIGVSTDLLSFDPFSFQSLGETDVKALVHSKIFEIEDLNVKSKYLRNIRIQSSSLVFDPLDEEKFTKVKTVFEKGLKSILWKEVFQQFELNNGIIKYKAEYKKDFIAQLKNLESIFVFQNEGLYEVLNFVKGQRLLLRARNNNEQNLKKLVSIQRIKEQQTGLDLVQSKKLDLYYPSRPFPKGNLEVYKDIEVIRSKESQLKLRLYYKYKSNNPLSKVYCLSRVGLEKVLGRAWVMEKTSCESVVDIPVDLNLIYSDSYNLKFLDFLYDQYTKSTGKKFIYRNLKSTELTKNLKMGQFDYYLSLERVSSKTPVLFDSFHSTGRYNTYRIKDSVLDKSLEQAAVTTDLKGFYTAEKKARKRLSEVLPLVFSYTRPVVDYIKRKDFELLKAKSSKRLIFLNR